MKLPTKKDTEALEALLHQYSQYLEAKDEETKNRIGAEMFFSNPIVWLAYKYTAYKDTNHAIVTIADMRKHSLDHEGICTKRWHFLSDELRKHTNLDLDKLAKEHPDMTIPEVIAEPVLQELIASKSFNTSWTQYEHFTDGKRVAKWENYTVQ